MRSVSLMFGLVLFWSCGEDSCESATNASGVDLDVERLEQQLFASISDDEVVEFLRTNELISREFFYSNEYPDLNLLADRLYGVVSDPYVDTLYTESTDTWDRNEESVRKDLSTAITLLRNIYPETPVPRIRTLVSGLYNDLVISPDQIVIGIDFFIGPEATFRPLDIPEYILKRYSYDYLAPTVVKFVAGRYAMPGNENTMLSEMIDHGKVHYLISQLMPCTPEHLIMGYTEQELTDVRANQEIIWASMIENEILYETEEFMKKKFIGERPNVYEIGEKCPGRIGVWVGWQIVSSYMANSGTTIRQLMEDTDHHKIFAQSSYKPVNQR